MAVTLIAANLIPMAIVHVGFSGAVGESPLHIYSPYITVYLRFQHFKIIFANSLLLFNLQDVNSSSI